MSTTGLARIGYPGEEEPKRSVGARADGVAARALLLATLPARAAERRRAMALVIASTLLFCGLAPFAKVRLEPMQAFLPAYQSALVISDLITVALLIGQFGLVRSKRLLLLAGGYLFCALMAVFHALSFPGLFSPSGVLGGGPQTTAWIYFLWHAAFPLAVVAYALLDEDATSAVPASKARSAIALALGAAVAAAGGLTLLTTLGHDALPVVMQGNVDAPAKVLVATLSWLACVAALVVLWRRRSATVLDLWLMVVLCAWIFDIALAAVLNGGRFDLGWYAGRAYGLVAASFVMLVLLLESSRLYARLARMHAGKERALERHRERLHILHEIDRAIISDKKPGEIAGAVLQRLRGLLDVPRAIVNVFDYEHGEVEWLAAAGRNRTRVGPGVRYPLSLLGDLDSLKRGLAQRVDVAALGPSEHKEALLASGVHVYMAVPMIAGGELIGALSFGGEVDVFPEEQMAIAQEVAAQLAIAMRQAALLARVKEHAAELEARVQERTAELEAANKELESFSYSVSHDLRAPLRAVDGYALMLEEDFGPRLDDEGRRMLGMVRSSSQRMGQLIDDLLAFSRLGRQPVVKHPTDMGALVREVVAEQGSHAAALEIGELPPAPADRALLKQVWTNLVSNAIKYSGKSAAPRVEITARSEGAENVYSVRDNGTGFDMRFAAKLFGVFQRLHRQDEFPGTGVGLAIVQRIVARHGGRVWAEGQPGVGACFHFALPRSADA